ncbi:MAG: radical SAM protein, partial [Spirochaetota bacterium]
MKTVAIIAPIDEKGRKSMYVDFTLSIDNVELSLYNFYHIIRNNYKTENNEKLIKKIGFGVPAAGYLLESFLKLNNYDTTLSNNVEKAALEKVAQKNPLAVCLSTTMITNKSAFKDYVRRIRAYLPGTKIIAGGMFVWKSYKFCEYLTCYSGSASFERDLAQEVFFDFSYDENNPESNADIIVASPDGLGILLQILKELEKGKKGDISQIPNLYILNGDKYFITKRSIENINIDEHFTHWDLIDELPRKFTIRTSLGCNLRCHFCDFCSLFPRFLVRSGDSLRQELSIIKKTNKYKNAVIEFTDNNILFSSKRTDEICNILIESKINMRWLSFMHFSAIRPEQIKLIKKSGFSLAVFGLESGDQDQLHRMNKKQDLGTVKNAIELLSRHNIEAMLSLIIGYPGETEESIDKTVSFLNNLNAKLTRYFMFPLYVFPLSEVSSVELRKKWQLKGILDKWEHATLSSDQVVDYGYRLFKQVENIPILYDTESMFHNKYFFLLRNKQKL